MQKRFVNSKVVGKSDGRGKYDIAYVVVNLCVSTYNNMDVNLNKLSIIYCLLIIIIIT